MHLRRVFLWNQHLVFDLLLPADYHCIWVTSSPHPFWVSMTPSSLGVQQSKCLKARRLKAMPRPESINMSCIPDDKDSTSCCFLPYIFVMFLSVKSQDIFSGRRDTREAQTPEKMETGRVLQIQDTSSLLSR